MIRQATKPEPEPVWELATMFPYQGEWSESDYLKLDTNRLVEFTDGSLEFLPMPGELHQAVLIEFFDRLRTHASDRDLGPTFFAPLRLRIRVAKWREPDVLFVFKENRHVDEKRHWLYADLVMEVVSPDNPDRDYEKKREDYAELGTPEYWIVDPQRAEVTVLALVAGRYETHGVFKRGEVATSKLLDGFTVDVSKLMDAGEPG